MVYADEYIVKKEEIISVADKIREKLDTTDRITFDEIPQKVDEVYEKGKQAEYDRFWDAYQDYGNRTGYNSAYVGYYWNADTLRPKYTVKIVGDGKQAFANCFFKAGLTGSENSNLLDISHINIDVSETTHADAMFGNARVKGVTLIFSDKIASLSQAFTKGSGGGVSGMEITLLVPNPKCTWNNAFDYHRVKRLTLLEGTVIGVSGFNVSWANALPHDDLVSIVNALSQDTSGLSVTLSLTAVNNAFEGGRDGSEWQTLIASKPNWTIAYA